MYEIASSFWLGLARERLKKLFLISSVPTGNIPYILECNLHPFHSFRGLKNQMRIRFAVESWILEK